MCENILFGESLEKLTWQDLLCQACATLCLLISFVIEYPGYPGSCSVQQQCRFASSPYALTSSYIKLERFMVWSFSDDRMRQHLDGKRYNWNTCFQGKAVSSTHISVGTLAKVAHDFWVG